MRWWPFRWLCSPLPKLGGTEPEVGRRGPGAWRAAHSEDADRAAEGLALPLPAAVLVLREIPRVEDRPWAILGRVQGRPTCNIGKHWRAVCQTAGLKDHRMHDFLNSLQCHSVEVGHSVLRRYSPDIRTFRAENHRASCAACSGQDEGITRVLLGENHYPSSDRASENREELRPSADSKRTISPATITQLVGLLVHTEKTFSSYMNTSASSWIGSIVQMTTKSDFAQ